MQPVNILDARNSLSQLVSAATSGEDVVIAKRGKPVVRLVAIEEASPTGAALARWLTLNPVPPHAARTVVELDTQIAAEREGWE